MATKVLVVDDSAFMRKLISEIVNEQPDMEATITARNGQDALNKLQANPIDVVTLDVEMPVMDGLTTLKRIIDEYQIPVLMLSSLTQRSSDVTVQALALGAFDFVLKPSGSISLDLKTVSDEITTKIRAARQAPTQRRAAVVQRKPLSVTVDSGKRQHRKWPEPVSASVNSAQAGSSRIIVAIGSSTGGPRAVEEVFLHLPQNLPACVLVTQHMPKGFTRSFAERLNGLSQLEVKEGAEGDALRDGHAFIAPGDYHMIIDSRKRIHLNQDAPVQFLRPAVDVTMQSLPPVFGQKIIGVVLTGMGRDGTAGMAAIKKIGGHTIAQDRATSTIYSMPRVVFEEGYADYVLPIDRIAEGIIKLVTTCL